MARLSYEDSCRRLEGKYIDPDVPPLPQRMPHPDDEGALGVCFFRTMVREGDDLSNLTLPRTFFGRSEISKTAFRNTDLRESYMCWNDFADVDFSNAVLAGCDMRASQYLEVNFEAADMTGADMRLSSFVGCNFEDATLKGAILTRAQGEKLALSRTQRLEIAWAEEDGQEPAGG
ncbi:hypothetical protein DyAD56_07805 [Dyella sp. AD56]|uniref:pentapeptide repeat-containing protein n=1 Tax=Dyella sp. AD56 TaxID=1528744 RepID=UPI000C861841|nr:pentapeptide repeat-containing protein [Dyella sp. AD56]PMQ05791.1 hypothetical protein DyAD56_07805 [Dyella sp. AD56]